VAGRGNDTTGTDLARRGAPTVSTFATAAWLFRRLLGFVYLVAFGSLLIQARGLIGHDGILPADAFLTAVGRFADAGQLGLGRVHLVPTILWLGAGDRAILSLCAAGVALAALLVAGIGPLLVLPLLWLAYLSLTAVSGEFLSYQWDTLLLEAGVLAIASTPAAWRERWRQREDPPRLGRFLLWWLLFRLMFGSGIVKLTSGDPTWRSLTAMMFHYETQPIPTPLAWYAHQLPVWFQRASTAAVLGVELVAPWFVFAPRRFRHAASAALIALQALIALTGNYAFFNVLTIALCISLLDDDLLGRLLSSVLPTASTGVESDAPPPSGGRARWRQWAPVACALLTVPVSVVTIAEQTGVEPPGASLVRPLRDFLSPFRSINPYGLFAVMTTSRPEIVVEGSDDGLSWRTYAFKYKAGDERRRPPWVAPYQPRLDWQMWFAALGQFDREEWFQRFCVRLLEGSPSVLGLLAINPFPDHPPRLVRSTVYQYHFADAAARRQAGVWWVREREGEYSPVLSLPPGSAAGDTVCYSRGSITVCRGSPFPGGTPRDVARRDGRRGAADVSAS
jgi:hypothetical protein